jgi:molybdate transport system permease protein
MREVVEASLLSATVAVWATLICVPLALLAATCLHASRWRSLEVLFLVPLFWSPTVSGFLLLWTLSPSHSLGTWLQKVLGQIVFTPSGTVLACVVVSFPLAFQACMIGRARVAKSLEESGQVLGGTPTFAIATVVWPQMAGAILVAALLVAARSLGEFGASILLGGNIPGQTQTLPLLIYSLAEQRELSLAALGAAISAGLGLLAYVAMRRLEARASVKTRAQ